MCVLATAVTLLSKVWAELCCNCAGVHVMGVTIPPVKLGYRVWLCMEWPQFHGLGHEYVHYGSITSVCSVGSQQVAVKPGFVSCTWLHSGKGVGWMLRFREGAVAAHSPGGGAAGWTPGRISIGGYCGGPQWQKLWASVVVTMAAGVLLLSLNIPWFQAVPDWKMKWHVRCFLIHF